PAARRSSVVLPQPDGPTMQRNSPDRISRLMFETIVRPPSERSMLRNSLSGRTPDAGCIVNRGPSSLRDELRRVEIGPQQFLLVHGVDPPGQVLAGHVGR